MTIQEQVCTAEQSKKLVELGVTAKSTWVVAIDKMGLPAAYCVVRKDGTPVNPENNAHYTFWKTLPAYTVAELGAAIQFVGLYTSINTVLGGWAVHHVNDYKEYEFPQPGNMNTYVSEAEARADILIHLLETNLITAEEVNNRLTN